MKEVTKYDMALDEIDRLKENEWNYQQRIKWLERTVIVAGIVIAILGPFAARSLGH